jgi:ectoine hydroxylase-related dioxygenase (phytanoyl-CoA dioxygenase family)
MMKSYSRNGYAVIPSAAPSAVLDRIASDISQVFIRRADSLGIDVPKGATRADLTSQVAALFGYDPAVYMAAAKVCQHLISVHQFGVGNEVLSIVEALGLTAPAISTRPVIHFMADGLRIEGGYHKTPAHQDWRSVQGSVDGVTMWIPLFDVAEDDYPLEIIPESHREGLRPSEDDAFGHRVRVDDVQHREFVALSLKRGDIVVFSGFLIHRTGANGGPLVRVALSYRFNNAAEPAFIRRNYPDRYIYRAQNELLDPEFPSGADLERAFGAQAD